MEHGWHSSDLGVHLAVAFLLKVHSEDRCLWVPATWCAWYVCTSDRTASKCQERRRVHQVSGMYGPTLNRSSGLRSSFQILRGVKALLLCTLPLSGWFKNLKCLRWWCHGPALIAERYLGYDVGICQLTINWMHVERGHELAPRFVEQKSGWLTDEWGRNSATCDEIVYLVCQARGVDVVAEYFVGVHGQTVAWRHVKGAHWLSCVCWFLHDEKLTVVSMLYFDDFLSEFFCFWKLLGLMLMPELLNAGAKVWSFGVQTRIWLLL